MEAMTTTNTVKEEHVQVEETDDSCRFEFFEIVPLARDTDGSSTRECVSGDWSAEVKEENLTVVKQEQDDVCCNMCAMFNSLQSEIISTDDSLCTIWFLQLVLLSVVVTHFFILY